MKINLYIAFILSSVLFTQCYQQVDGSIYAVDKDNVIYVDALLKNNSNPEFRFTSAVGAYSSSSPEMLNDDDLEVSLLLNGEGIINLNYEHDSQVFTNRSVKMTPNNSYTINAISKRDDIDGSLSASTSIPQEMDFSDITIDKDLSYYEVDSKHVILNVTLDFDHEVQIGQYYFVEPINRIVANEDFDLPNAGDFEKYTINNVFTESNFVKLVNQNHGLAIDNMNGDALNSISMNISLDNPLEVSQLLNHVYFRLYHITEDYYMYLKSGGSFNNSGSSWFVEPVIQHSNVVGGRGILGGASISLDSTAVN